MSQTLYEEAIAEARRLTEMAEQNAKNKIIDAVTPQIKRLIEQELMGDPEELEDETDAGESEEGEETIDLDAMLAGGAGESDDADEQLDNPPDTSDAASKASAVPASTSTMSLPSGAKGPSSLKISDGEVELKMGNVKIEIEHEEEEELEESASRSLTHLLSTSPAARRRLRDRLVVLEKKIRTLKRAMHEARSTGTVTQKRRLANIFEALAREAVTLRKQAILTERSTGGRTLETNLVNSIIKEMKNMSRRSDKNVFDFLFEAEDEKKDSEETSDDAELDLEAGDSEDTAAGDVDVSAAGDALKALGDALGLSVTVGDEGESDEGDEEGGEDEDGGEAEGGDMELDLGEVDMTTDESYEESDMATDEGMYEADDKDTNEDDSEMKEGETYEIDESALRRELRRLRRVNEGEAVSAAGSFGGGAAGDEMFVDVDEETLLNALADELGDAPHPKMGGAGIAETRRSRAAVTEARALRRQVNDYRNVAGQLKKQLVEMNLFNAKLLYANKLMQNRDLSAKQQRAIVEALDNAKTLREAKLLYKSLTASLNKASNKGSLSEGRVLRTLGSSSKSARSAQPTGLISESGGTDRWALLAGIKKD
jgi:hypothetical protein